MTPTPGSDEALAQGCRCPVIDNHYGAGFPWGTTAEPKFWINSDCPLHGVLPESAPQRLLERN